jgi:FkbM family methyltransferase
MGDAPDKADPSRDNPEEQYAKKQFGLLLYRLRQLPPVSRAKVQGTLAETLLNDTGTVETPAGPLSFVLMGKVATGRVLSLLTKQPATIKWIDAFPPGSVMWDIGANVGVFTMFAALRGHRVVAFEPAAVNYFLLAANCEANKFSDRVDCLLAGVGGKRAVGRFTVSQFDPAASFSVQRDPTVQPANQQTAFIVSMDGLIDDYGLPCPNYVKIDAPGMSEAIIEGGSRMLQRPELRQIHIELREDSRGGPRIIDLLQRAGLVIVARHEHGGGTADLTFARRV